MTEVPDYSGFAECYSASRPGYPRELFGWLASVVRRREVAWDTATGNGQAAVGLAVHFDRVIGTDTSAAQIAHAKGHPRVEYRVGRAEDSRLASDSVDLVVAASALHWFDLPAFYKEAQRVARRDGVLAAWSYHVAHVESPFGDTLWRFYRDIVQSYFSPGARLVDDRYEGIVLPGRELESPRFILSVSWTAAEILRFVRTWSGVQAYIAAKGDDPVKWLAPEIERLCGSPGARHVVRWPLYLRASRL
jgi:SAM-dependent methyltransferase